MLQIYTKYKEGYVLSNDIEFNTNTLNKMLNDDSLQYKKVISTVENVTFANADKIISKINGEPLSMVNISTGCKTILNIMYNQNKIISTLECGDNYSKYIYKLDGKIYMPDFLLPLNMDEIGDINIELFDNDNVIKFNNIYDLERWYYEQ